MDQGGDLGTQRSLPGMVEGQPPQAGVVVIVDDEMMVTSSLQTMLMLQTSHTVHCFNHPGEALGQLPELKPDVVISDFSMPGMDGLQFLREVRTLLPEATLMLLTGYADKESAIEAINAVGIYRYLEKPWDNDDLKISIDNGLERSRLIGDLRRSVTQLNNARTDLEHANQHLEALVRERTQDLRATYQHLSSIVNNATDGIITLDARLCLQSVNPAAERWFRQIDALHNADLTALPVERFLALPPSPSGKIPDPNAVRHLFADGNPSRIDEIYIGNLPLEASIAPLAPIEGFDAVRDTQFARSQPSHVSHVLLPEPARLATDPVAPELPRGFVVILRDIAARRELERMRDDFISTLTHDLRTPLLAAIQTLGFFADGSLGALPTRQEDLVRMLIGSHKDMLGLVNVLLDVYRYEAGNQQLIMDQVDPWELIELTARELESLAREREQTLTIERPPVVTAPAPDNGMPLLKGDKRELKRVFTNIIGNAIHYTPKGGKIRVFATEIRAHSGYPLPAIQVAVEDNGRGIPAQDIPMLFQRFSQGTSRQRSSGSGLGLYLSRQIVEAHHGKIWVESEENKGSCFYIQLPLVTATTFP